MSAAKKKRVRQCKDRFTEELKEVLARWDMRLKKHHGEYWFVGYAGVVELEALLDEDSSSETR